MIHPHDLPLLMAGVRAGLLDPERVGAALTAWDAAAQPRLPQFLVDRGLLTPDALRRLEATAHTVDPSTPQTGPTADPLDEVSALVAGRLDETPTADASGPGTPRPNGVPDVGPRYRLLRLHRGGGLGEVWAGFDTEVGRPVAIKVLRADRLGLPSIDQRFLAEGKAAGRLEHPNIVPVYDLVPADPAAGRDAAHVMRFVAGRTLAEVARDHHAAAGPGEATQASLAPLLDAFVLVCKAVAFAHARGVLHRDLKGSNIIVGEYGEVQLLDWGLAKPVMPARPLPVVDPADTDLTAPFGVVGTPGYLAPEVADGDPASRASDVYGLGATLYALLTGRPPADGPTPQATLEAARRAAPPAPRAVNPRVPVALDAIIRRAIAPRPEDRYPSADALAQDVRDWLADEPVAAHPDGPATRLARWGRRHRPWVVAGVLGLLALVVGLGVGAAALAREERKTAAEKRLADASFDAARRLAAHVADLAVVRLPGGATAVDPRGVAAVEAALAGFEELRRLRPDLPDLDADTIDLRRYAAAAARTTGRFADAERHSRRAADLTAAAGDGGRGQKADALRELAGVLALTGRLREADETYTRAVEHLSPAGDESARRGAALVALGRATVARRLGEPGRGRPLAAEAAALFAGLTPAGKPPAPYDQLLEAAAVGEAAACDRDAGDHEAAWVGHRKAVALAAPLRKGQVDPVRRDAEVVTAQLILDRCRSWLAAPTAGPLVLAGPALAAGRSLALADANLGVVVISLDPLVKAHPQQPLPRAMLATALLDRADRRRPAAGRADAEAAVALLEPLVAAHPEMPEWWAELGRGYAALARSAAPAEAADLRRKARAALDEAVARAPDDRYIAAQAGRP